MRIAVYRLELLHFIRYIFCSSTVYYFRISKIVRPLLSFIGTGKFRKIDTDAIKDYPSINANAMNTCTEYLFNSTGIDCAAMRFILERLGKQVDASESYYLKSVATRRLYDTMLYSDSLLAFEEQNNIHFNAIAVPKDMRPYLDALSFNSEKRHIRYQLVFKDFLRLGLCMAYLSRRLLVARRMQHSFSKNQIKYVTELSDMSCFDGSLGHPNSIEKAFHLEKQEIGYFKFAFNCFISIIKKSSSGEIKRFVDKKKINYIDADSLRAKTVSRLNIFQDTLKVLFNNKFSLTDTIILIDLLVQLYSYHALFDNFPSIKAIYTYPFPSGWTSWRWNTGVITAIARLHNAESIGCQTRAFYLYKYEDVLDCFDKFYFWLPGWYEALKKYMLYVKEIDYLDDLGMVTQVSKSFAGKERQAGIVTAAAFPSDCSYSQHYNISYNVNFIKTLFAACRRFKNLRILFKAKDPANMAVYRKNKEVDRLFDEYSDQMIIVEKKRGDVWNVIESADMVIGIGFTDPALRAALAGYKVLIYQELKYYNKFLDSIDMQISSSTDDFVDKCGDMIEEISAQDFDNRNALLSEQQ